MRRILIALGVAVLILGATSVCFLLFEDTLGPAFAFWPGFVAQGLLEQLGVFTTNRILPWVTLLFWWLAVWLVLSAISRGTTPPNPTPHSDARETPHPATEIATRAGGRER